LRKGWLAAESEFVSKKNLFVFPNNDVQALEHYEDLADIKRAIVHTTVLQPDVGASSKPDLMYFVNAACFALVACHLLQPPDNGAVYGLLARNAPRQHPSKSSSRHPDCDEVLRYSGTCQAYRNVRKLQEL